MSGRNWGGAHVGLMVPGTTLQYIDFENVRCFRNGYTDVISCVHHAP